MQRNAPSLLRVLRLVTAVSGLLQLAACASDPALQGAGHAGAAGGATAGTAGQPGAAGAGPSPGGADGDSASAGGAGGGAGATSAGQAGAAGTSDASADGVMASGDAGPRPTGPSAGCEQPPPSDALDVWIQHDLMVTVDAAYTATHSKRKYYTRLPKGYDPTQPYPVAFYGPGCGASGSESTPLMGSGATDKFIQVFLLQAGSCFSTSNVATSPELPYFDAALAGVQAGYCTDKSLVFLSGFSSGSWLSNMLGCARAGVIRGIGTASGGLLVNHGTCTGPVAGLLIADSSDTTNPIMNVDKTTGIDRGSGAARDNLLMRNGCTTQTVPWDAAFPGCVAYQGCQTGYPVVWCLTSGQGHSNGGMYSAKGWWKFWSALP